MAGVPPGPQPGMAQPVDPANFSQPNVQGYNQTAEFFLSNYRLGKTLGIGSFGKVWNKGITVGSFIDLYLTCS